MHLDLKSSLMLRLVAGALACFLIAAGFALFGTYREVRQVNARVADVLVKRLQVQLSHIESGRDAATRFPDFDLVSEHLQNAGQCVQYVESNGTIARSSCIGFNRDIGTPPTWFAALCGWIPAPQTDVVRLISYRDKPYGSVVVTTERAAVLAAIWKEVSGMLALTALVIGAICILQYGAISRVLRPTKDILAGLDSLARGDLSTRLPHFRLIELQRISEAFNTLAANLERTTREKMELAAKLVDHQELGAVPEAHRGLPAALEGGAAGAGDEIGGGRVVDAVAGVHGLQAEGDREHCLADSGRPDQQGIGLLLDEPKRGELIDQAPAQRRLGGEVELLERLGLREVGEAQPPVQSALLGGLDLDVQQIVQELGVARLILLGSL